MKKLFFLTLLVSAAANAQFVAIPDANLKNVLLNYPDFAIDTNSDNEIDFSEAHAITAAIDVSNRSISDMTGIEAFGNIAGLFCQNNAISTLDLSEVRLSALNCSSNPLVTLNIKNGSIETTLTLNNLALLEHICADEPQIAIIQEFVNPGVEVNSYCSFVPGGDYNTITGAALFDSANNGCDDSDIHNNFIKVNANGDATFSRPDGNYEFYTGAGNYTVTPQLENESWFGIAPSTATVNFPANDNSVSVNDFCLTAIGIHRDVEVVISSDTQPIPDSDIVYKIVFRNKGNQTLSGNLTFAYDGTLLAYVETEPFPTEVAPGSMIYDYLNLLPFENRALLVTLHVSPTVNVGDVLNCVAAIGSLAGDEIPEDNTFNLSQTVVTTFSPNNIICSQGSNVPPADIGKYLHYMINFDTNTSAVENVVIENHIDTAVFDIHSLQVLNSSHDVVVNVRANTAEFIFKNVNSNPIGGHGNVLFKVKTLPTLQEGDVAAVHADIYFDYNAPISTNEAQTTFSDLQSLEFAIDDHVVIYPNPMKSWVTIRANSTIKSLQLFDSLGRILQVTSEHKIITSLDISDKPKGIYFLRVTTANGSKVEKLVKE